MIDLLPIGIAFIAGLVATFFRLPPLVGYLVAGFTLQGSAQSSQASLELFSEFGIILLLFTIGLKLQVETLTRREVLSSGLIHFCLSFLFFMGLFILLSSPLNLGLNQAALISLSLTFSSTVFMVKLLEERGDFSAHYGQIALGILIIQDLIAVIFLAASHQKLPHPLSLLILPALLPFRSLIYRVLDRVHHGELMVLFGIATALLGAFTFDQLQLKADLGALVFGVVIAQHPRADELSKALLSLKNFFLLGFFLTIGMVGLPKWVDLGIALGICLLLPLRSLGYYFLLNQFGMRSRTSFMASLSLLNYSEFGLIVMAMSHQLGWIGDRWMVVLALVVTFSFIFSSSLNRKSLSFYEALKDRLKDKEKQKKHELEKAIFIKNSNIIVMGLGRVGRGAYDYLVRDPHWNPIGIDHSKELTKELSAMGYHVICGDATNADFWSRLVFQPNEIQAVLLCMPLVYQNIQATRNLRKNGFTGKIYSIAKYPDEIERLEKDGVNQAFNLYAEAGVGFAQNCIRSK